MAGLPTVRLSKYSHKHAAALAHVWKAGHPGGLATSLIICLKACTAMVMTGAAANADRAKLD
jgi:hypothetical protein